MLRIILNDNHFDSGSDYYLHLICALLITLSLIRVNAIVFTFRVTPVLQNIAACSVSNRLNVSEFCGSLACQFVRDSAIFTDIVMNKPSSKKVSLAYQNTYGQLVSFFRKRLDNAHDATDLSQDVFALWLKRAKQTPVEHTRAFLFKIAHRVLIDYWRSAGKRRLLLAEDQEEEIYRQDVAPFETDPHQRLEHQQRLNHLEAAINSLPPRRRQAFVLHRFDGLSQVEVAERMGISVSMVEKHIAGALVHCKRYLAGQESVQHDE